MEFHGTYYTRSTVSNCSAFSGNRRTISTPWVTVCNRAYCKKDEEVVFFDIFDIYDHYHHSEGMLGISNTKEYRVSDAKSFSWWCI